MVNRLYIIINKLFIIINQFYVVVSNLYIIINKLFIKKIVFLLIILKIDMKLNKKSKVKYFCREPQRFYLSVVDISKTSSDHRV